MKNLETPGKTRRVGRYERGKKDQPPKPLCDIKMV